MLNRILFFLMFSVICFSSCKDTTQETSSSVQVNQATKKVTEGGIKVADNQKVSSKDRASALSILNFRIKKDAEDYAIVEAGVFEYQFVYDGKQMSAPGQHDGDWIDFQKDHKYTYGKYNESQGSGNYHYLFEEGKLLMIDDDSEKGPQEWDVKSGNDVLILVGNATYGNNAYQMKLLRLDEKPKKG